MRTYTRLSRGGSLGSIGEEGAIGGDVFLDTFAQRREPRRPAQLRSRVLDRDDTAEQSLDLVLGGHRVPDLDAASRYQLSDQPRGLSGRDKRLSGRRIEDPVGVVTAAQAARLVAELIPGSSIEVGDAMTPEDEVEASFRGVISIANAQAQLGWAPRFATLREGVQEYISTYRAFLADRPERAAP